LSASVWLQHKKEKEQTCKNALLVWLELHGNLATINDILARQRFPEATLPLSCSTSTWKEAQIHLVSLPIDDLKSIGAYYQALPAIDHLINAYAGKELTPNMVTSLTRVQTMCVMTQHLLSSYWDLENVEKHRRSFMHMRQQYSNYD
jgi:hypothetical protein